MSHPPWLFHVLFPGNLFYLKKKKSRKATRPQRISRKDRWWFQKKYQHFHRKLSTKKRPKNPPFHAPSPSPFPFPSQNVKCTHSIRHFVKDKIEVENEISYKDQRTKMMVDAPNSTLVNLAKEFSYISTVKRLPSTRPLAFCSGVHAAMCRLSQVSMPLANFKNGWDSQPLNPTTWNSPTCSYTHHAFHLT